MRERTAVRYEGGAIYVTDPDPVEEIRITYARKLLAATSPLLGSGQDAMGRRQLWYTALELARCCRDLLIIIDDARG
ncbi:hypothetical protein M3765_18430 [Streptomyces thermoviolaceus]|uniref:hypothetical protein n=1 Tax=Streptomyces thermoviolaceus TaxID=1952 RepID=UPI00204264AC|nr:hypothetical protein [Streptomyces thermoviolaceus]MCM3265955.1 hypothetical protein [Streptomyces thermoviolaceus]